jgi:hypothetical protein
VRPSDDNGSLVEKNILLGGLGDLIMWVVLGRLS